MLALPAQVPPADGRPALAARWPLDGLNEDGFRFTVAGEFGAAYRIDGSTSLPDWTPLGWLTNRFGTEQFTDTGATNGPWRLYRAAAP